LIGFVISPGLQSIKIVPIFGRLPMFFNSNSSEIDGSEFGESRTTRRRLASDESFFNLLERVTLTVFSPMLNF
jgi:hypothetical protein